MEEIWKDIEGYEGLYKVSNLGRIYSSYGQNKETCKLPILRGSISSHGYRIVGLTKNKHVKSFFIHRLVAKAFIPNPENKPDINHIDGNKENNNINNLEWCTKSENTKHAHVTGLMGKKQKTYMEIMEIENGNKYKYTGKIPYYYAIPFNELLKNNNISFEEWLNKIVEDITINKYGKLKKYIKKIQKNA